MGGRHEHSGGALPQKLAKGRGKVLGRKATRGGT